MNRVDEHAHLPRSGIHVPSHPFSETFPPPYRVLLLLSVGILGWALNLHGLQRLGIDTEEVLSSGKQQRGEGHDEGESQQSPLPLHEDARTTAKYPPHTTRPLSVYGIAIIVALWTFFNWSTFRTYVTRYNGDPSGRHAQALQAFAVLGVLIAAIWPGNVLWKSRRRQFAKALVPLFHPTHLFRKAPSFPSILLADILTSFAKVFGDVWLTVCFLVPRKEHHTWWNGRGSWVVPALVSLPYAIRLVQCLSEYRYAQNTLILADASAGAPVSLRKGTQHRRNRKPLANALKYASAFPVIWISASQSSRAGAVPEGGNPWWNVWLLSVMVNSLFSFWWDVTNDWGLELLKPATWTGDAAPTTATPATSSLHRRGLSVWPAPRGDEGGEGSGEEDEDGESNDRTKRQSTSRLLGTPPHKRSLSTMILRPGTMRSRNSNPSRRHTTSSHNPHTQHTMFFAPSIYHVAIILDLILRFTWSLKLSSHLAQLVELESGVFLLEVAELLRRTGWVFLRVEWEVVKRARAGEILDAAGVEERFEEGGADTLAAMQQYRDTVADDQSSALSLRTVNVQG